jgi:phage terminase small subunit
MSANVSLTPKQERFIDALLEGLTIVAAAEKCGVAEKTAHRWLKQANIQQAYEIARKRLLNHSLTALQLKFDKAVKTLDRHMEATKTIPRDQIKAAEVVVDKTIQTAQLVERIAELEAQLAEQEQDRLYKVTFDLRQLTKEERQTIEAINDSVIARESSAAQ